MVTNGAKPIDAKEGVLNRKHRDEFGVGKAIGLFHRHYPCYGLIMFNNILAF